MSRGYTPLTWPKTAELNGQIMIGGKVLQIDGSDPHKFWVTSAGEGEACVHATIPSDQRAPEIGESLWWQSGKIWDLYT